MENHMVIFTQREKIIFDENIKGVFDSGKSEKEIMSFIINSS